MEYKLKPWNLKIKMRHCVLRSENPYLHFKKKNPITFLLQGNGVDHFTTVSPTENAISKWWYILNCKLFPPNKCVLFSVRDCKASIVKWPWLLFLFLCTIIMNERLKQRSPMQTERKYYSRSRVCPCLNRYMLCISTHWLLIYLLN